MLSKNTVKFIKSLHQKKFRNLENRFLVEGGKSVLEVINSSFFVETLVATPGFLERNHQILKSFSGQLHEVTQNQLENIGTYQSNKDALVVVEKKKDLPFDPQPNEFLIALDDVKDPGNLGTILRIADWYGISRVLLSPQSAEVYNPKVIQSSMGSFTRVTWSYEPLGEAFLRWNVPVYGAFLEGENVHKMQSLVPGILLMGNESNGISKEIEKFVTKKVNIPGFGETESLNVAVATAILTDNFKRLLDQ